MSAAENPADLCLERQCRRVVRRQNRVSHAENPPAIGLLRPPGVGPKADAEQGGLRARLLQEPRVARFGGPWVQFRDSPVYPSFLPDLGPDGASSTRWTGSPAVR